MIMENLKYIKVYKEWYNVTPHTYYPPSTIMANLVSSISLPLFPSPLLS